MRKREAQTLIYVWLRLHNLCVCVCSFYSIPKVQKRRERERTNETIAQNSCSGIEVSSTLRVKVVAILGLAQMMLRSEPDQFERCRSCTINVGHEGGEARHVERCYLTIDEQRDAMRHRVRTDHRTTITDDGGSVLDLISCEQKNETHEWIERVCQGEAIRHVPGTLTINHRIGFDLPLSASSMITVNSVLGKAGYDRCGAFCVWSVSNVLPALTNSGAWSCQKRTRSGPSDGDRGMMSGTRSAARKRLFKRWTTSGSIDALTEDKCSYSKKITMKMMESDTSRQERRSVVLIWPIRRNKNKNREHTWRPRSLVWLRLQSCELLRRSNVKKKSRHLFAMKWFDVIGRVVVLCIDSVAKEKKRNNQIEIENQRSSLDPWPASFRSTVSDSAWIAITERLFFIFIFFCWMYKRKNLETNNRSIEIKLRSRMATNENLKFSLWTRQKKDSLYLKS